MALGNSQHRLFQSLQPHLSFEFYLEEGCWELWGLFLFGLIWFSYLRQGSGSVYSEGQPGTPCVA